MGEGVNVHEGGDGANEERLHDVGVNVKGRREISWRYGLQGFTGYFWLSFSDGNFLHLS